MLAIITGYTAVGDVKFENFIFAQVWNEDVVSWTATIVANANAGNMESARKLYDILPLKKVFS
ncbi:hypothetical protein IEQ34_009475 [Dendrobium chrysotoxum]|uniref:Uncharacterized protein n=1 Tax=Dendrobium chrysotoxum TaxID=161865 RepID=A0AAV7H2Z3_DENCH|nr:hypothetical protein IEQ34_009475 [Dendrobium chrysotoxum]